MFSETPGLFRNKPYHNPEGQFFLTSTARTLNPIQTEGVRVEDAEGNTRCGNKDTGFML
jgi:hypothetical protein